jgi:hypothetical protein
MEPQTIIHRGSAGVLARSAAVKILKFRRGCLRSTAIVLSSDGSSTYTVVAAGHGWYCDCPYGARGDVCKHKVAVAERILKSSVDDWRHAYKLLLNSSGMTSDEFKRAARMVAVSENPTPEEWVEAAEKVVARRAPAWSRSKSVLGGTDIELSGNYPAVENEILKRGSAITRYEGDMVRLTVLD